MHYYYQNYRDIELPMPQKYIVKISTFRHQSIYIKTDSDKVKY